jgi:hypothetical protein
VVASQKAAAVLDSVPMETADDVNNVVATCDALGFAELAAGLAEVCRSHRHSHN